MVRYFAIRTVWALAIAALSLYAVVFAAHHQTEAKHENWPAYSVTPDNQRVAAWTPADAARFHNCRDAAQVKRFAAEVVVVNMARTRAYRESFDAAWDLNHDAVSVNNVWVIGKCF